MENSDNKKMTWILQILNNWTECEVKRQNNTSFIVQLNQYYYTMLALTGLNSILSVVGIVLVTKFQNHHYHFIIVIKCLVVFELLFNASLFIVKITHVMLHSNLLYSRPPPYAHILAATFLGIQALTTAFQLMRNWSVVIIAAIRYHSLTRFTPFHTQSKLRVIHVCIYSVVIFSLILGAPRFIDYSLAYCGPEDLFLELQLGPLHDYGKHTGIIYHGVVLTIVQSLGPLLIVTVLSIRTSMILRRRRRLRAILVGVGGQIDRAYGRMNRVVAILTISFSIFETPVCVSKVFMVLGHIPASLDLPFAAIANVAVCLDSLVNFAAYVLGSTRVRICKVVNSRRNSKSGILTPFLQRKTKQTKDNSLCNLPTFGMCAASQPSAFVTDVSERQECLLTCASVDQVVEVDTHNVSHSSCTGNHLCETDL